MRHDPRRASNAEIAQVLDRVASLLEVQDADGFRVRAYRNAAATCRRSGAELCELVREGGRAALEELPGIGPSISTQIVEWLRTGRLQLLDRLEGEVSPEDLFRTLPGVGEGLAHALHEALGAETLEDVEVAAEAGRLEEVPGVGPRRAQAIRDAVRARLGERSRRWHPPAPARAEPPPVALLLAVDREYREKAAAGKLRRIAPRRFNPEGEAWLPVLHVDRDGYSLTALHSNTARAHRLGRTRDWVVIFAERNGDEVRQTVVTEYRGPLAGRRVVRGREDECARLFEAEDAARARPTASSGTRRSPAAPRR
jgi:Holliday junction resolvasome RuvABC DNA-binding subunit